MGKKGEKGELKKKASFTISLLFLEGKVNQRGKKEKNKTSAFLTVRKWRGGEEGARSKGKKFESLSISLSHPYRAKEKKRKEKKSRLPL